MNGKLRMKFAMTHRLPDRVPVMCQLAMGHYFLNSLHNAFDIWFDSETFAMALAERQKAYAFDGLLINLSSRPPSWRENVASLTTSAKNSRIIWKNGFETHIPFDDNPQTICSDAGPLPRADYKTIDVDDPAIFRTPGYVWNIWHAPELWGINPDADLSDPSAYPAWFAATLIKAQQLSPDVSIHVEVFSPFTHLMEMFGYEQALFALIDSPDTCHKLLQKFTLHVLAEIQLYARHIPDAILISSAFAGAGFISRTMYQEFVLPYERVICDRLRELGLISYVHTCGAIGDRLDLMCQTGVDGIDTLDPPPLGTIDLAQAKAQFGTKVFFKGNLNAIDEILNCDEQTFENAVKKRIEIGKPNSGYILSSACSVPPHALPARLKRLAVLAAEFGGY